MTRVANEVMIGLVLGFGVLASLIAIAGPPTAQQQPAPIPTEQCREVPSTDVETCRELQPSQCVRTPGCVFYEHAKWPSCRSVHDRSRVELFDARSTTQESGEVARGCLERLSCPLPCLA